MYRLHVHLGIPNTPGNGLQGKDPRTVTHFETHTCPKLLTKQGSTQSLSAAPYGLRPASNHRLSGSSLSHLQNKDKAVGWDEIAGIKLLSIYSNKECFCIEKPWLTAMDQRQGRNRQL